MLIIFVTLTDTVMRPSDLFYAKLTPLLKEHGITNLDNRKEWPVTVLVQVLTALMKETPDDLLAKYGFSAHKFVFFVGN